MNREREFISHGSSASTMLASARQRQWGPAQNDNVPLTSFACHLPDEHGIDFGKISAVHEVELRPELKKYCLNKSDQVHYKRGRKSFILSLF